MKHAILCFFSVFALFFSLLNEAHAQLDLFGPFLKSVEGISMSTERTFKNDNPGEDHDVFFRKYSVSLKFKKIEFGSVVSTEVSTKLTQIDLMSNCCDSPYSKVARTYKKKEQIDSAFKRCDTLCATVTRSYKTEKVGKKALSLTPIFGYSYDSRLAKIYTNSTINLPNDGLFVKGIITHHAIDYLCFGVTLALLNIRDNSGKYSNPDSNRASTFKATSSPDLTGEVFIGLASKSEWLSGFIFFGDFGYRIADIRNISYTSSDDKKVTNSELNDKLPHTFDLSGFFFRLGISIDMSPGD